MIYVHLMDQYSEGTDNISVSFDMPHHNPTTLHHNPNTLLHNLTAHHKYTQAKYPSNLTLPMVTMCRHLQKFGLQMNTKEKGP